MGNNAQSPSLAHADQLAREQGFPDYATWKAWNAKRAANAASVGRPAATGASVVQQGAHSNWLQQLLGHIPPFSIIGGVSDAYGKATGT